VSKPSLFTPALLGADCLHVVQVMPLHPPKPRHLLPRLSQAGFTFSGTGLSGLSWKRGTLVEQQLIYWLSVELMLVVQ